MTCESLGICPHSPHPTRSLEISIRTLVRAEFPVTFIKKRPLGNAKEPPGTKPRSSFRIVNDAAGSDAPFGSVTRRRTVRMRNVDYFYLAGEHGGYVAVPAGRRRGTARTVRPKRQKAAPVPGPTLVVGLADRALFKRLELIVRIAPASSPDDAGRVAAGLRSRARRRRSGRRGRKRSA